MIMRRTIVFAMFLCLLGGHYTHAQTVNNVPVKEINAEHIEIAGKAVERSEGLLIGGTKVTIQVDFGQEIKAKKDAQILKETGKPISLKKPMTFNSMMDALNFWNKHGYEFHDAYAITHEKAHIYHYILKKKDK